MTGESLLLDGCAPTPLASYLKALGVLRLISSPENHVDGTAADADARGYWGGERFHLQTMLNREALLRFFLVEYAPSPIIAPWNGRAGFLEGDEAGDSNRTGAKMLRAIRESNCRRLEAMRRTINALDKINHLMDSNELRRKWKALDKEIRGLQGDEKKKKEDKKKAIDKKMKKKKSELLPIIRSETDQLHVGYIDACYVLTDVESASPILGSGGNDGSRDFGVNFAESIKNLVDFQSGDPKDCDGAWIESALFSTVCISGKPKTMGQFSPGHGGPNATTATAFKESNPLNPWDVVLAMEGTMVFAGAITRRWGAASPKGSAFPFTFQITSAGAGCLSQDDPNQARGEIWTPIWAKPARFAEVSAVFREGRLTIGRRAARTGLDAARSIAQVGASRGIGGFDRYSLVQPDGKMPYLANPLGRFNVPDRPRKDIAGDLEEGNWLFEARRLVNDKKKSPDRARKAMRLLEDSLFQMTTANYRQEGAQHALIALGSLVAWMATSPDARGKLSPPPMLSPDWIREADDDSAEFRVAAALSGLGVAARNWSGRYGRTLGAGADDEGLSSASEISNDTRVADVVKFAPPMAAHFAPLDEKRWEKFGSEVRRSWPGTDRVGKAMGTAVWRAGELVPNIIAVLERRLIEAATRGMEDKPLAGAMIARLADVSDFLFGRFDDARCAALLSGLVWVRSVRLKSVADTRAVASPAHAHVPFAYAAIKPVFMPNADLRSIGALSGKTQMPVPPEILAHLRTGGDSIDGKAVGRAVRAAFARARASGLATPFDAFQSGSCETVADVGRMGTGVQSERLAAALLIPVGPAAAAKLINRAYPGTFADGDDLGTEEQRNAA